MLVSSYKRVKDITSCPDLLKGKVYIQEKIDGYNASLWCEKGFIHYSHSGVDYFGKPNDFYGLGLYLINNAGIKALFKKFPDVKLNGEWLVKKPSTQVKGIEYDKDTYETFYLYDIDVDEFTKMDIEDVYTLATEYQIKTAPLFGRYNHPSLPTIKHIVGQSQLGKIGEGLVFKNHDYFDVDGRVQYAEFKTPKSRTSLEDKITQYRSSPESKNELTLATKYITHGLIMTTINDIFVEKGIQVKENNVEMVAGIAYSNVVYYNSLEIAKTLSKWNESFSYHEFENICKHKARTIFKEVAPF